MWYQARRLMEAQALTDPTSASAREERRAASALEERGGGAEEVVGPLGRHLVRVERRLLARAAEEALVLLHAGAVAPFVPDLEVDEALEPVGDVEADLDGGDPAALQHPAVAVQGRPQPLLHAAEV